MLQAAGAIIVRILSSPLVRGYLISEGLRYITKDDLRGAHFAGASGAGKSTLSRAFNEMGLPSLDYDDVRSVLYDKRGYSKWPGRDADIGRPDAWGGWRPGHPHHEVWKNVETEKAQVLSDFRSQGGTTFDWGPLDADPAKTYLLWRPESEVVNSLREHYRQKYGPEALANFETFPRVEGMRSWFREYPKWRGVRGTTVSLQPIREE